VEIKSLIAGGPAEKSGQLSAGDKIIAIADDDPPQNWGRIDLIEEVGAEKERQFSEVIKQLRGTAGAAVHIRIKCEVKRHPALKVAPF